MKLMLIVLGGVSLFTLVACSPSSVLEDPNDRATRSAQETARVETAVFVGTQVSTLAAIQATADSAVITGTQLAQLQQENLDLQGTIVAVTTFGVPVVPRFTATPAPSPTPLNQTTYTDLRTTTGVDENGCPTDRRGRFSESDARVYFTARAINVVAGTRHKVQWLFEEEVRYESAEWTADQNYGEVCMNFWLEPSYTPFTVGIWTIYFFIDDQLYTEVPFEFCAAGELC